ncbi:MAG: lysylphosphatidylglycerol synthase transmembrane domain-containing protein [bacterium]
MSAGLITLLLAKLDVGKAMEAAAGVRWDWMLLALATFAASLVLGNVQWVLLLRIQGIDLGFRRSLSFYFVGAFFNNFLPANIGGDVVRIYDVYKDSGKPDQAIAATVTDRLVGMITLAVLAVPAGLYAAARYDRLGLEKNFGLASLAIVAGFAVILTLAFSVVFSRRLARLVGAVLRPFLIRGLGDRLKRIYESFYLYSSKGRRLLLVLVVSLVVQALRTLVHYQVSEAMGLGIPAIYFFLFVPVIAIFIALPISIGGLGVREGLGIYLFRKAVPAVTPEQAFAMGLLAYLVGLVVSLAGGVIYLARGPKPGRIEKELEGGNLGNADGR